MSEHLLKSLPGGLLLAISLIAAIVWIVAPELGQRRATRLHLDACIQSRTQVVHRKIEDAHGGSDLAAALIEKFGVLNNEFARAYGFDRLARDAMQEMTDLKSRSRKVAQSGIAARCRCLIRNVVYDRTRLDHALFVGTLKLVRPEAIRSLGDEIHRLAGTNTCTTSGE